MQIKVQFQNMRKLIDRIRIVGGGSVDIKPYNDTIQSMPELNRNTVLRSSVL